MGDKATQLATRLAVKECAELFRQTAGTLGSSTGRLLGKLGMHDSNAFFTPTDNSPFSGLDDDKPHFSVGVGVSKFNAGAKGNASFVHMYVWDRGDIREVLLACGHGIGGGGHARRSVDGFVRAFQAADPGCQVETVA